MVVIYAAEQGLLGKRYVLDKGPIRIGRGADNAIVLEGDSVSRRHCHFDRRSGNWHIIDDGSTNGTFLADKRASGALSAEEFETGKRSVMLGERIDSPQR